MIGTLDLDGDPLFVVDGRVFRGDLKNIGVSPIWVKEINVLTFDHATEKYGKMGENGVVEISMMFDKPPVFEPDNLSPNGYLEGRINWKKEYGRMVKVTFDLTEEGQMIFVCAEESTPKKLLRQIEKAIDRAPRWHSVAINGGVAVRARGSLYLHSKLYSEKAEKP